MAQHPPSSVPPSFEDAVREVSALSFRDDLVVRQIAAPTNLAPHALALAADVRPDDEGEDSAYGTGRFILLHDPDEPAAWGGAWRVVCFAQAPLEVSIAVDPLLAGVAWSWLMDALESRKAEYRSASGTSTKTLSRGFGTLEAEGDGAQIELRASWSPAARIAPHVEAWAELVCMLAGLPPGSEDITVLGSRRSTRG